MHSRANKLLATVRLSVQNGRALRRFGEQSMVNIICTKWGRGYGPEYVNHLRNMVRRNLSLKHRFVCFTDDTQGIEPDVETQPLPEVRFPEGPERYWNKLGIFSKPLSDLGGPVLYLDLDVVIVASIDCFFEIPGSFFMIRDYRRKNGASSGNTSVCRFEAGAHSEILERFHADPRAVEAHYVFDQDFVTANVETLAFWPEEWCPSFRKQCMGQAPRCYFQAPRIPPGARIVIFHGNPKPPDAISGGFIPGGIKYCRQTPWVAENWR